MRGWIVRAHVVDRLGEAVAEEVSPHAVDNRLGHLRRGADQLGQFLAAANLAAEAAGVDPCAVHEDGVAGLEHAVALLPINLRLFGRGGRALTGEIAVLEMHERLALLPRPRAQRLSLAEEGVELPEG